MALHFASGAAFFSGAAMLIAGLLLLVTCGPRKVLPAIGRMLLLGGIFCLVMSATPLPVWAWCVWAAFFAIWCVCLASRKSSQKLRTAATAAAAICTIAAAGWGGQRLVLMPGLGLAVAMNAGNYSRPIGDQGRIADALMSELILPALS